MELHVQMCHQESFFVVLAVPACRLLFTQLLFHTPNAWTTRCLAIPIPPQADPPANPHGKSNYCLVACTKQCRTVWPCFLYFVLFAGVYVGHGLAPPAAHVAAPDKLAFTPFHVPDDVGVVPAPTAEEVAAVGSLRGAVTFPSLSPRDPQFLVFDTVIGRFVHIQQVFFPNWYFSLAFLFPA